MNPNKSYVALCALFSAISTQVIAQDVVDQEYGQPLEEVTVFGTKIERSIQDIEISVEVFDAERLDREQITDLEDLLLKVPNVNTVGGADANFSIRGIGRSGVGGAGQGVTSSVYVDGSPITSVNFNRGPIGLWDIEQVEILRGPQSSVQGRNALAGGIFVKTADPTFDVSGKAKASFAEGDTHQLAGAFGGPLIDGLLAGRIAIDSQGSNGFLTNDDVEFGGADFSLSDSLTIRGKLLLQPEGVPQFSTKLTVDIGESELVGEDVLLVRFPVNITDQGFDEFDPTDLVTFRNELVANDNESLRLVSETEYEFNSRVTGRILATFEEFSTVRTFGDETDISRFGSFIRNVFDDRILSLETRFEFNFENIQGLVGAYYLEEERARDATQNSILLDAAQGVAGPAAAFIDVTPPESQLVANVGETFDIENYALFAQFDWQLSPRWGLGFGARYDVETFAERDRFSNVGTDQELCQITLPEAVLNPLSADPFNLLMLPCDFAVEAFLGENIDPETSDEFEAFLPRASLTYSISENSSVFVSASRGYRAGGAFVAIRPNETSPLGVEQFVGQYDPEFLNTIEIGTRNVLIDGDLTLNANVFYSQFEDQQVLVDGFDPAQTQDDLILNAGESTIFGLELQADYNITNNIGAFFTIGLLETEFDDFAFAVDSDGNPTNPDDPRFANLAGNEFGGAPNVTFSIGGDWEGQNGLFASASFSYIGAAQSSVLNISNDDLRDALEDDGLDPDLAQDLASMGDVRTDLTGRFGWRSRDNRYQVYLFGTNLLDNDGLSSRGFGSVARASGELDIRDVTAIVQQPRVVGLGFDFQP